MPVNPNDRHAVETAFGRKLYCELGPVEGAEFHVREGVLFYERCFDAGFVRIIPGVYNWSWFAVWGDRGAESCSVYPTPKIAMDCGVIAYKAIAAGGQPSIDWTGDPRGFGAKIELRSVIRGV